MLHSSCQQTWHQSQHAWWQVSATVIHPFPNTNSIWAGAHLGLLCHLEGLVCSFSCECCRCITNLLSNPTVKWALHSQHYAVGNHELPVRDSLWDNWWVFQNFMNNVLSININRYWQWRESHSSACCMASVLSWVMLTCWDILISWLHSLANLLYETIMRVLLLRRPCKCIQNSTFLKAGQSGEVRQMKLPALWSVGQLSLWSPVCHGL